MTTRLINATDLYALRLAGAAQIAPDGQRIAFTVTTIDRETHAYQTAIWLASVAGAPETARPFVADGSDPRWSPDGQSLAFLSKRVGQLPATAPGESGPDRDKRCGKGKPQIWVIPTDGGEARQLTFLAWGVGAPAWSPDSRRLAFSANTGEIPEMPEQDGKPEPRARRLTRWLYRFNGAGYTYELRSHLFVLPLTGGAPAQITDGDWDDAHPAWSPDGQMIAFNSDRSPDRWQYPKSAIWRVPAAGGVAEILAYADVTDFADPAWSPDGGQIACLGAARWGSGGHTDVFVFQPGSPPRCLTTDHFQSFSDAIGSDMRNDHADATPRWSPDSGSVFVFGNARGAGNIYRLAVADGVLTQVTHGDHQLLGWSLDQGASTIAMTLADPSQPGDLFVQGRDSGDVRQLTHLNQDRLAELDLATPETIIFTGQDGWEIEGWLIKPPGFDPARQYPLLLEIHGGPNTCYGHTLYHEFQLLAAHGYVVLYTNPRGSTSYGRAFGQAVHGHWGAGDFADLMAGVDAVIARGYIDPDRLGVLGGSYGGFMTTWTVGHTPRFRAAISDRAVNTLTSFFGTSDIGPFFALDHLGTMLWDDPARYAAQSPLTYAKDIHTPLLIIHSEEDYRCPIEQAEQLFTALLYLGCATEMIRFEGQNHDLSRNGHPRLRVERLEAIVDWFTRYIPATAPTGIADNRTASSFDAAEAGELAGAPSPD